MEIIKTFVVYGKIIKEIFNVFIIKVAPHVMMEIKKYESISNI